MTVYKKSIKLQTKIMLLMIFVVFISIAISVLYISAWRTHELRKKAEESNMALAYIISSVPLIRENLGDFDNHSIIENYINNVLYSTGNEHIIVVVDMNNKRYAHPVKERIGETFVGGDEERVLSTGESYISQAEGTLGAQIRAFVPVFNSENIQVGFVMVGKTIYTFKSEVNKALKILFFSTIIGLTIGAVGAYFLSQNIKRALLGLEPEEIANLYVQRESMLEALHEGIVAIDDNSNITLVNNSAIQLLKLDPHKIIGHNVFEVFPSSRLEDVLITGNAEYYLDQVINDIVVVINRVPIKRDGKIVGAIATFSDRTKVKRMAEEITGFRQMVDALRANTHEFSNKLHTILGLIDLGEIVDAKKFIMRETDRHQKALTDVLYHIKDSAVAGLIIGKSSRANELAIKFKINENSRLEKLTASPDSSDIITILGNLLENAMDSLGESSSDNKALELFIREDNCHITIKVTDNGEGISQENIEKIFKLGFSTKNSNRGQGLFIVKKVVDALNGSIEVNSSQLNGTEFIVALPKGE